MITYYVTADHPYTMERFLSTWGESLQSVIRIVSYESLHDVEGTHEGNHIFSDLERLSAEQLTEVSSLATRLEHSGCRVLNHPRSVLCRYELLTALKERGVNSYKVYRSGETPRRFPVFVRGANDHDGALSGLLHSEAELSEAVAQIVAKGKNPANVMVTEYLHTADAAGVFRKYSCFVIGERFIPRHLLFSDKWCTKKPDLVDGSLAQEEAAFLESRPHPHEVEVRKIFAIAGINYGRIDYAVVDGKVVVWEINTNPIITIAGPDLAPERYEAQAKVAEKLCEAFRAIDSSNQRTSVVSRGVRLVNRVGRKLARAFLA